MKPTCPLFSIALSAILFFACSTSTTNAVVDDDEVSSSAELKSSSSSRQEDKRSSSSVKSSSSKKTESSSSFWFEDELSSNFVIFSPSSTEMAASIYEAVQDTGIYTSKDSVAAYLCKFDKLPRNYVSKNEGQERYESSTGNTFSKWNFNPWKTLGVMIGGDNFNNFASDPDYYHSALPEGKYREADVDYGNATSRGTKRLVYQSGCIIYYTADHYDTFFQLNPIP